MMRLICGGFLTPFSFTLFYNYEQRVFPAYEEPLHAKGIAANL